MFCNVCSREINSPFLETVGSQFVCCLSCVGLLEANNEDNCNHCHRPVWKDNYYIIDSKYYCSEKCKIIAVKKYLKKNINIKNVNVKHIQNEYFRKDSPSKNIQELRKEVRELYNDFKFDESNTIKSSESSINKKYNDNDLKEKSKYIQINDKSEKCLKICNNNKEVSNAKNNKKYQMIPNKKPRLKSGINILKNYLIHKNPRSIPKKKEILNYKRSRSNFSFDNQDEYFNGNNYSNIIKINPPLKYSSINNCHSICNINQSPNNKKKSKPTILKYQNKRQKLKTIIVHSPNMSNSNVNDKSNYCFKSIKCCKSLEKNENENYDNIQYDSHNNYTKIDNSINNYYQDENRCQNFHVFTKSNNQLSDRIIYYYGKKYK